MANEQPLNRQDWFQKTYDKEIYDAPVSGMARQLSMEYGQSGKAYRAYKEGFDAPYTVGTSGLSQDQVGALPQWDFMNKFATGELGQKLPEQSRFLTENMKYSFGPYFNQATANTYKRGFTSDGTQLPKAYEPLYKASISGLGESLSALKYKEDESKRMWEALRIQERVGMAQADASNSSSQTADPWANFLPDALLGIATGGASEIIKAVL